MEKHFGMHIEEDEIMFSSDVVSRFTSVLLGLERIKLEEGQDKNQWSEQLESKGV